MTKPVAEEHSPANLLAAYEMLLEELEGEINAVNARGAASFGAGDHVAAAQALERAQALTAVQSELLALQKRLRGLVDLRETPAELRTRLRKGLKTPEEAYRAPILSALVALGGRAEMQAVLERVYTHMQAGLNEYDLAPMPSDERIPRWRNTAQWCRNTMRAEGLIKDDSPHGVWEISEAGRAWLAERE